METSVQQSYHEYIREELKRERRFPELFRIEDQEIDDLISDTDEVLDDRIIQGLEYLDKMEILTGRF